MTRNLEAQVAVLTNEDSRLEATLAKMRQEAAELQARLGIEPKGVAGDGGVGHLFAETGFDTSFDPALLFAGQQQQQQQQQQHVFSLAGMRDRRNSLV